MPAIDLSDPASLELIAHACSILDSHEMVVGRPLIVVHGTSPERAAALYEANMVVLSHGLGAEPRFNYGNLLAQRLFELPWSELVGLASRLSAEPVNQAERQRLLDAVSAQGYIDDYAGVRISKSGRRFRIERATVWNVVDGSGVRLGQAAAFTRWSPMPESSGSPGV